MSERCARAFERTVKRGDVNHMWKVYVVSEVWLSSVDGAVRTTLTVSKLPSIDSVVHFD